MSAFEIVRVQSGEQSLRSLTNGEVFHPVIGPMREARELHVAQQDLRRRARQCEGGHMVLWDVGLGAAANAIAAIEELRDVRVAVEIHSFDQTIAPLEFALRHAADLVYPVPHLTAIGNLLDTGRAMLQGISRICWHLHLGDFARAVSTGETPEPPDAIFYDPYSPKRNADMWTLGHLKNLRERLKKPCLATTYTRSTAMRVTFLLAGFFVGRGSGIGEKDETTLVATEVNLLKAPLEETWLDRVGRSCNAAPLTDATRQPIDAPIRAEHLAALREHPQFQRRV